MFYINKKSKIIIASSLVGTLLLGQSMTGAFNSVSASVNQSVSNSKSNMDLLASESDEIVSQGNGVYLFDNGEQLIQKYDENNNIYYLTKTPSGELNQKIYQDSNGQVMYEDLATGEVGVAGTLVQEEVEPSEVNGAGEMTTYSGYQYVRTVKNSTALQVANASAVAAVLTYILPLAYGVVFSIATVYASFNSKGAYWYEVYSNKYSGNTGVYVKTQYIFHRYNNYNSYIGTKENIQFYTGGPR